jgi:hypothetical protein
LARRRAIKGLRIITYHNLGTHGVASAHVCVKQWMKSYSQWCRRAGLETATAWVTTLVYDDRRTARDCIMLAVVVQRHFAARGFARDRPNS